MPHQRLLGSLVELVRASCALNNADVDFVRALDRSLRTRSENASKAILDLINDTILQISGHSLQLESANDIKKHWGHIETTFDTLSDRVAFYLTEKKPKQEISVSREKPQTHFSVPVDNRVGPFKPLLSSKLHAKVPLSVSLEQKEPDSLHQQVWYDQPYKNEIQGFEYPLFIYKVEEPVFPPPMEKSAAIYVDTPKQLTKMLAHLRKQRHIAVDVEHHNERTYLGLTCVIQISSDKRDYVIDSLALRTELQQLNEVFCDPKVLKVFHGAQHDILWLQRDLGVYVVGLFDTFHAASALSFPKCSLAYLLSALADFAASKKHQLADWRKRPLSKAMLEYARSDTHFLLYIYRVLLNRLIENEFLDSVLEESRKTSAQRYEKPLWNNTEDPWLKVAFKYRMNPNSKVLEALYRWRDALARELDESPTYVMSNHVLASIIFARPTSRDALLRVSGRLGHLVHTHADEIAALVKKALDEEIAAPVQAVAPPSVNTEVLFDQKRLESITNLKQKKPTLFKSFGQDPVHNGKVYLAPYNASDLPKADPKPEPEPEHVEPEPQPEAPKPQPGRRIVPIVDTVEDDLKSTFKQKKKKKNESAQEAFDFASAQPVADPVEARPDKSKRRAPNNPNEPRGAHQRNRPKARTFRSK